MKPRTTIRLGLGLVASLALLSPSAEAQYINRALWLGDEEDPFRRDYDQDAEYFVNRWSFVDRPPWWRGETLDPFGNRLFLAGGSVRTSHLTLENVANTSADLGSGFTARMNYLQSENQTNRYQRIAFGLDAAVSESTAIVAQFEGTPDKSRADASVGAEFLRTDYSAHRLMFTTVDPAWRKSQLFEYESAPYGLMFVGFFGDPEGIEFAYDLSMQLPFEQKTLSTGEKLQMHRTIGFFEARARLGERDRLIIDLGGEITAKERSLPDPGALEREDADIGKGRLHAEWWRSGEDGREYALGASYLRVEEDYDRPNDSLENLRVDREELMLSGRTRLPLGSRWSAEPYVIGGHVDLLERHQNPVPSDRDFDGFQGKLGTPFRYDFSDHAWIRFDLSIQLDQLAFGGGGFQLLASF